MTYFSALKTPIRSKADLARMVGLKPNARRSDIISAFGRATRCEAWMHIEEEDVLEHADETWEIRIVQGVPRCRVFLRQGGRGGWSDNAADIPAEVLAFFDAREDKEGRIVSLRSWKSWSKVSWARHGRQLKGRSGEIHAVVEIAKVGRKTGLCRASVIIEALGAARPEEIDPVRLALPVNAQDIHSAIEGLMKQAQSQMLEVA